MDASLVERVGGAKRQVAEGALELWNARLELLRSVGDVRGLLDHLRSPIEPVADNGNCGNCACGSEALGGDLSLPTTGAK